MLTRLGLGLIWLLHFLPLSVQAMLGRGLGRLIFLLGRRRRRIALINLRLCFPEMTEDARVVLARAHFAAFGRSFLERGILWWAPEKRIRRLVRVEGEEHLAAAAGTPVILLTPHFVGLDMGWTRLTCDHDMVSVYANQKNFYFNAALLNGRERFGKSELLSRQAGIRRAIRAMQEGLPFYYLPDMDYGQRDTIFVPFFGYPTATITGVSRLARMCGAKVIPCVTKMLDGGEGYMVKLYPAWDKFPGADIESDTRRMNAFIEERILEMPAQYYWVHRRFKTRPPGETKPY
jgi:KDO2-lipid IV(A) lauroyltransferase